MGDLTTGAMAQHCQVQPLGIHLAILAAAPDLTGPAAMDCQGLQHLGRKNIVVRPQRQDAGVLAQNVFCGVPRDVGEGGIHQHDLVIGIGNQHAIGALVQHPACQLQLGRRRALVGHITAQHQHV